jgi:hypothetical protein
MNASDKKMSKMMAQKNNDAAKKYGSKQAATQAYSQKLASQNKYSSPTPPSQRPTYVPSTTNVGGKPVNVTYNRYPGGGYGYGYYDPMTHAFIALAATQMIVSASDLEHHGYGHYSNTGAPVVVHSGPSALGIIFSLFGIAVLIVILVLIVRAAKQ